MGPRDLVNGLGRSTRVALLHGGKLLDPTDSFAELELPSGLTVADTYWSNPQDHNIGMNVTMISKQEEPEPPGALRREEGPHQWREDLRQWSMQREPGKQGIPRKYMLPWDMSPRVGSRSTSVGANEDALASRARADEARRAAREKLFRDVPLGPLRGAEART